MTAVPPREERALLARARRAFRWFGILLPSILTIAAVVIQLAVLPQVPDPVAVHWGASGEPDGYAAPWTVPLLTGALGGGMTLVLAAFALIGAREGEWGPTMRFLGALTPAVVGGLVVIITWTFVAQVGSSSWSDAGGVVEPLVWGGATGIVLGVVGWVSQPSVVVSGGSVGEAAPLRALGPGERAVWVRTASLAPAGMIVLVGAAVILFTLAGFDFAVAGGAWPILAAVAVVLTLVILATVLFRVRVDEGGLRVSAPLGLPRFHIPLDEIDEVKVVSVNPMADFGGWGLRKALDGRTGVVLRRGEALEVHRAAASTFVVTVDDAATAAGLLQVLRDRAAGGGTSR